ncbi:hypothetical protein GS498_04155 [Rhodococcus hoagii]|nr:hypothetical protein [Prescottella equi]
MRRWARPTISATRPRPDHPDGDVAIWLNVLVCSGTPACSSSTARWSSGCGATTTTTTPPSGPSGRRGGRSVRPYTDNDIVTNKIAAHYIEGVPTTENWDTARARYNQIDPASRVHQRIHGQAASVGPP